jgi:biopolymer transport protein ExbD
MNSMVMVLALFAQDSAETSRRILADLPANGTLALAGQAIPWKDVAASLKKHAESGIRQLVLRVDGTVPFSNVQTLMAAAREAGLEGVQFSADKPVAPVTFSADVHRSIRIKVREGAKGLELLVLQEASAVSLDDLRKKLKTIEKAQIVIDAEVEVPTGAVQQIVTACTQEGFDKVSFAGTAKR